MRKYKIEYSWTSACRKVRQRIEQGSVSHLTVDVFDTLLLRTTPPESVIHGTCAYASLETGLAVDKIEEARQRAWVIEAERSQRNGNDPDVKSSQLFKTWALLLEVEDIDAFAERMLRYEIDSEAACLTANGEMRELLEYAVSMGVAITALSDMYLSAAEVTRLLSEHGFADLVSRVYTSADVGVQKRTGRLFDWFVKSGNAPEGLLHIGDDTRADGLMPSSRGIYSIAVFDRARMAIRHDLHDLRAWPSRIAQGAAGQLYTPSSSRQRLGFERFGPVYTGFLHAVAARAKADRVSSVWFFAREGWLLHEIYESIRQEGLVSGAPPSGYLYASRVAMMRTQLDDFGDREVGSVLSDTWNRTYRSTLSPLQLAPLVLEETLASIGANLDDVISDEGLLELRASDPFRSIVRDIGRAEITGLREYLNRTGFPLKGRVAVVDVGWGGQIQENFILSLRKLGIETEVVGYYLGTDERAEERRKRTGMSIHGLVVDKVNSSGRGLGAFSGVQALELATRAAHGSVRGYQLDGTPRLVPDTEPGRRAEAADDAGISEIQQGILAYAGRFIPVARAIGVGVDDSLSLARDTVDVLALVPNRREARVVTSMKNIANLGMDETIDLGGEVSLWRPRELVRVLRSTLWQEGTVAITLPFVGPMALLAHRFRKGLTPRACVGSVTEIPSDAPDAAHDTIVVNILGHDLTAIRNELSSAVRNGGVEFERRSGGVIRDLVALALIRIVHRSNVADVLSLAKATIKGKVRHLVRHPFLRR